MTWNPKNCTDAVSVVDRMTHLFKKYVGYEFYRDGQRRILLKADGTDSHKIHIPGVSGYHLDLTTI